MRVLIDYAHEDLWESLELLFTDRFGWELFRPIGMEWHSSGIWAFDSDKAWAVDVAHQFLDPWATDERDDGDLWSTRGSVQHPWRRQKLVTLAEARELGMDLVIATLNPNEVGLHRFAMEVGAHYGIQAGNQGVGTLWPLAEFGLLSITTPGFTPWKPHVTYHQEFSTCVYRPEWPPNSFKTVATRVQCITGTPDYERFKAVARELPEHEFRWYGHCGDPDELYGGDTPAVQDIADSMRATAIAYHAKRWSDGYGHVIHAWASVGRPLLVTAAYYRDKLAGQLMIEGQTSFDVDRPIHELAGIIRKLGDPDYHRQVSEAVAARFKAVVDFEAEAEAIRAMLENVLSDRLVSA